MWWQDGYRAYAVRTGSMHPTYSPGDLIIDEPTPSTYAVGDVITFRTRGGVSPVTTHRVHEVGGALTTKGDANDAPDVAPVQPENVVGRVVGSIPNAGYVLVFFKQPAGIGSVMTAVLALMLLWGLFFPGETPEAYRPRHLPQRYRPRHQRGSSAPATA
jgi:signal peptidase